MTVPDRAVLDRHGPMLAAFALGAAMLTPFGSLPPVALGYWDKAEPLIVWCHLTSGLAALAVAINVWQRPGLARTILGHPYVLLPAALALWSAVTAAFCPLPLLSLFGAPQSGLGALWFLDLSTLTACALVARTSEPARRILSLGALAIVATVAVVKFWDWHRLNTGHGNLLIFVAAYYGWLALPLPVAALELKRGLPVGILIAMLMAVASHSAAAIGLLILELGIVWGARTLPLGRHRALLAVPVLLAAVLPFAVIDGLPSLWRVPSLWDRHLIWSMTLTSIRDQPWSLILGHGWGRIQDGFQEWLNVSGQRLWNSDWIFLTSDYFNSHNWGLETLHAVGIPGALLFLGGFLVLPLFARPDRRGWALGLSAATLAFAGLWFQLCLSLPFHALASAGCARQVSPGAPHPARGRIAVLVAIVGALQIAASAMLLEYGIEVGALRSGLDASPPATPAIPTDFRDSDLAMAEEIRDTLIRFAARAKTEPIGPIIRASAPLLSFLDDRIHTSPTILLTETGLDAMAEIHVTGQLSFLSSPGTEAAQLAMWRRWVDRALFLAPGRSDLAIPYFTKAIALARWEEIGRITRSMLARAPDDPVGLYYQGIVTLMGGDRKAGMEMIRRSVDRGIERFMPIDSGLKAQMAD
jgi:hypothetical protein